VLQLNEQFVTRIDEEQVGRFRRCASSGVHHLVTTAFDERLYLARMFKVIAC
jgi:hypothetical protein